MTKWISQKKNTFLNLERNHLAIVAKPNFPILKPVLNTMILTPELRGVHCEMLVLLFKGFWPSFVGEFLAPLIHNLSSLFVKAIPC